MTEAYLIEDATALPKYRQCFTCKIDLEYLKDEKVEKLLSALDAFYADNGNTNWIASIIKFIKKEQ